MIEIFCTCRLHFQPQIWNLCLCSYKKNTKNQPKPKKTNPTKMPNKTKQNPQHPQTSQPPQHPKISKQINNNKKRQTKKKQKKPKQNLPSKQTNQPTSPHPQNTKKALVGLVSLICAVSISSVADVYFLGCNSAQRRSLISEGLGSVMEEGL